MRNLAKEKTQNKEPEQTQEITVAQNEMIVMPMVTPEQAKAAMDSYQNMVRAIVNGSDYQQIGDKSFKKKSAWRKLATAFNLSVEIIKEERKEYDKYFVYEVTAKATAPNGRVMTGLGSCASNERGFAHVEHDVRATAETRAKNRCISDLIGAGEVSAEEMGSVEATPKKPSPKKTPAISEEEIADIEMEEEQEAAQEGEVLDDNEPHMDNCPKGKNHHDLRVMTVNKEGANKGRTFISCSEDYGGCGYFKFLT